MRAQHFLTDAMLSLGLSVLIEYLADLPIEAAIAICRRETGEIVIACFQKKKPSASPHG